MELEKYTERSKGFIQAAQNPIEQVRKGRTADSASAEDRATTR
jgi:hypothetical protein